MPCKWIITKVWQIFGILGIRQECGLNSGGWDGKSNLGPDGYGYFWVSWLHLFFQPLRYLNIKLKGDRTEINTKELLMKPKKVSAIWCKIMCHILY